MPPVVTVEEMRAIDADAPEPVEVLIERAGRAVARAAIDRLGGRYGRRVVVVAGPGNNGADGRVAARVLAAQGVGVTVLDAAAAPPVLPAADLVIDAAFGTGLRSAYVAPDPGAALVLAVDIPSGVDGTTGVASGSPMRADVTVTFAAPTPGLFLADGPAFAGDVIVADIGLDVARSTITLVDDAWARAHLPARATDAHKWLQAVLVIAGSVGMTGAATLAASAAQRAGAGMVQIATPGVGPSVGPVESVALAVDEATWAATLLADHDRAHAVVIGPGLGTALATRHQVREFVRQTPRPVIVDGDGLTALGADADVVVSARTAATVLTPHDGEFERLAGHRPGGDRIADVRVLAARVGATVLSKGPTTIVADPDGVVRLVCAGDQRLATAGTGDVLAGVIGALLAAGCGAGTAAALGAALHGRAAMRCAPVGMVAGDVVAALPEALASLVDPTSPREHGC